MTSNNSRKELYDDWGISEWSTTRKVLTIALVVLVCGINLHDNFTNPSEYQDSIEHCLDMFCK